MLFAGKKCVNWVLLVRNVDKDRNEVKFSFQNLKGFSLLIVIVGMS